MSGGCEDACLFFFDCTDSNSLLSRLDLRRAVGGLGEKRFFRSEERKCDQGVVEDAG